MVLATVVRLGLGSAGVFASAALVGGDGWPLIASFVTLGLVWWTLVAKGFFRRTPWPARLAFAAIAELIRGTIDYFAYDSVRYTRFC